MPQVGQYTRQIDPKPAATPTRQGYQTVQLQTPPGQVTKSPAAAGAGLGAAAADIGQEIFARELERQDAVRLTQAERKLSDWHIDRLFHPGHGALYVQGEAVYGLPDKLGEDFDKTASAIGASLNERQRARFEPMAAARRANAMASLNHHVATESRQIDLAETKALVANETSIAIANADNPQRVALGIGNVRRQTALFAERNGWGPEQTRAAVDGSVSDIHVGVLNRYLNQKQDIQAKAYYEHAQQEIDGGQRGPIEKDLEVASTAGEAMRAAQAIRQKNKPATDTEPFDIEKMADQAREMFAGNAELAEAAIGNLKKMHAERESSKSARASANQAAVWSTIAGKADTMTVAELTAMPEYRALPGPEQEQARLHILDRGYTLDQRAASAADYLRVQAERVSDHAWQLESRPRQRKAWEKQDKETSAYAAYEDALADPQAFAKMTPDQIIGMSPALGRVLMNDLLTKQREFKNASRPIDAAIDGDLFNDVANNAGVPVYEQKKTPAQKAQIGALRKFVFDRIDAEQRANSNKELDRTRKREIMDAAVLEVIPVKAPWFGFNTPARRAFETTIDAIPQADRQRIRALLRNGGAVSDDAAVIQQFIFERTRK